MSWFSPKCPVSKETKEWIERSMLWLLEEFGEEDFRESEIVFPSDPRFPSRISTDDATIYSFLDAVCEMMRVDRKEIHLSIFENPEDKPLDTFAQVEREGSKACGLYYFYGGMGHISINRGLTSSPASLVATLAHELVHHILRSDQCQIEDLEEEEFLTDLASIFFGMGIFTSNAVFSFEQFTNTMGQGWKASREGYIDEETAGYALACFAYMKGETKPVWKKYLETNPGYYYKQALNYLVKTGDTKLKLHG